MNQLVVANWKMNLTAAEAAARALVVKKRLRRLKKTTAVLCPSFINIPAVAEAVKRSPILVGAQDVYFEDHGAYTGEVSALQLREFVSYCIVGHSERRRWFYETDYLVAKKTAALVRAGITPIICVGEVADDRKAGHHALVVRNQVEAALRELAGKEISSVVIAYEPIWAISTSEHREVCSPPDAAAMAALIRSVVAGLHGEVLAKKLPVLYGGSVTAEDVGGYLREKALSGTLVGGASLDPDEFAHIVLTAEGRKR